ncbi:MAG: non-heme iron oxygenase ferredoxin subunit [Calditrichaeota bacterium]|nr:non-heme iron oxygenase ferredoxin subunit [Calditrichota bacterium]
MWVSVLPFSELAEKRPIVRKISGQRVALVRIGEEVFAFDDVCTHEFAFLSEGQVLDHEIECPLHGARFDLATGEARSLPATEPIKVYPTRVVNGKVEVKLS